MSVYVSLCVCVCVLSGNTWPLHSLEALSETGYHPAPVTDRKRGLRQKLLFHLVLISVRSRSHLI